MSWLLTCGGLSIGASDVNVSCLMPSRHRRGNSYFLLVAGRACVEEKENQPPTTVETVNFESKAQRYMVAFLG